MTLELSSPPVFQEKNAYSSAFNRFSVNAFWHVEANMGFLKYWSNIHDLTQARDGLTHPLLPSSEGNKQCHVPPTFPPQKTKELIVHNELSG